MSLEDDVRNGINKGLEDYKRTQRFEAEREANRTRASQTAAFAAAAKINWQSRHRELIRNGDYLEAANDAGGSLLGGFDIDIFLGMSEALCKWGDACEQGSGKYPKDEAKAIEIWKTAAWYGNEEARKKLRQRGVVFIKVRNASYGEQKTGWLLGIAAGLGLGFLVSKLLNVNDVSWYTQHFIVRWLTNIAVFCAGVFVPLKFYLVRDLNMSKLFWFSRDWSVEALRQVIGKPKLIDPPKPLLVAVLAVGLFGWAPRLAAILAGVLNFCVNVMGIDASLRFYAGALELQYFLDSLYESILKFGK